MKDLLAVELKQVEVNHIDKLFSTMPFKEAVASLENLPLKQIRRYLVESGIISDVVRLREVAEASLAMCCGDEHSAIIAALEPDEIAGIVAVSPEIFTGETFHLIHLNDYDNLNLWEMISLERKEGIMQSGDRLLINRLHNFHPEPWTRKGESGPWGLFKQEIAVIPQTVLAYLSAIYNAERDEAWKEQSAAAMGVELLAYGAGFYKGIKDMLLDISPKLAAEVEVVESAGLQGRVAEIHFEAKKAEEISNIPGITKEDKTTAQMIAELRAMGIENPTSEDVEILKKTSNDLEILIREGIPEEGEESEE